MADQNTSGRFTRWNPVIRGDPNQQRLRENITQITNAAEFGPVPGAYTSFQWDRELPSMGWPQGFNAGVRSLPSGQEGLFPGSLPVFSAPLTTWSMWPMFVGYWIDRGTAKVMLEKVPGPGVFVSSGLPEPKPAHAWDDETLISGDPFPVRTITTASTVYGERLAIENSSEFLNHDITAPSNDAESLRPYRGQLYLRLMVYDAIDDGDGEPTVISCNLICKYLQKIEPPKE